MVSTLQRKKQYLHKMTTFSKHYVDFWQIWKPNCHWNRTGFCSTSTADPGFSASLSTCAQGTAAAVGSCRWACENWFWRERGAQLLSHGSLTAWKEGLTYKSLLLPHLHCITTLLFLVSLGNDSHRSHKSCSAQGTDYRHVPGDKNVSCHLPYSSEPAPNHTF